ncbi:MAG TPA: DUF72 domain-containing protein [Ktedonobacteraceae bacterium]|nr:DUF72 domain-containing protein [Ktedonobacteraceae bacterium]
MFHIGCPMWGYKEWVGNLFPPHTQQSDFLRLYSRQFNTVEGNTTFYATPSIETLLRWCQETPSTFRFCPKISRDISHGTNLSVTRDETLLFTERMRGLGERLGPMFLQLPPGFAPTQLSQLEAFLTFWPNDLRLAVEVRHQSFFQELHATTLNTLLQGYAVARVMMDTRPIQIGSAKEKQVLQTRERKPNLPLQLAITTDFTFVRYIGHPRMEVNEQFLDTWAKQMAEWLKRGMTIYTFCHCPYEVHSPTICQQLYQRVSALAPVPPLPSQHEQSGPPEQATLF